MSWLNIRWEFLFTWAKGSSNLLISISPLLSVVAVVDVSIVVVLVENLSNTISSSSPDPLGQFEQIWHKASFCEGDSNLLKERAHTFPRGDNYKIAKTYWLVYMFLWTVFSGERCGPWTFLLFCVLRFQVITDIT